MNEISIFLSIFIGVVSGILTSILIWIVVSLFKHTILPWYQSLIYRGPDIDGEWEGMSTKGGKHIKDALIRIKQDGNNVEGHIVLIKQLNGDDENKRFDFKGTFINNCLVITYEVEDRTRFGLGSCVLKLMDDGKKLEGYWTALNSLNFNANIFSIETVWERKS